ncbi:MAG: pyridoxal phosphate-dependent aminotransferase [Clostridiales Family XIII bacterium]|jgi:cystathionine beta-lyase|nr:pyridoxal phosphate-dependent aminotransferase [Clostridiales Family XIII bacterium]
MEYDFGTVIDRRGTNSLKWDFAEERGKPGGLLPMWVADMDIPAPPEVLSDLHRAVSHGIFGYTAAKQGYYDVLAAWFSSRFGFSFDRHDVVQTPGTVSALAMAVRAFTDEGDGVLIQTPVYYPFYEVIRDNARETVMNPLIYDNGAYYMDFRDFEQKIASGNVKLFLLCSPHNPVGRVWTRGELLKIRDICKAHGVIVMSDEVHCDFVWGGHSHTCFGTLSDDAVIATAPSKTFNLAGLQAANIIIKDQALRRRMRAECNNAGYSQPNMMGLVACQSAYTHGAEWLAGLKRHLAGNIGFAQGFLSERLPQVKLAQPQGTYLLWLDFSSYGLSQQELDGRITGQAKLWLDSGTMFGADGKGFERMNIACARATLADALSRLEQTFA